MLLEFPWKLFPYLFLLLICWSIGLSSCQTFREIYYILINSNNYNNEKENVNGCDSRHDGCPECECSG